MTTIPILPVADTDLWEPVCDVSPPPFPPMPAVRAAQIDEEQFRTTLRRVGEAHDRAVHIGPGDVSHDLALGYGQVAITGDDRAAVFTPSLLGAGFVLESYDLTPGRDGTSWALESVGPRPGASLGIVAEEVCAWIARAEE